MNEQVSFLGRVMLAFVAFFRVLSDGAFASTVRALAAGPAAATGPKGGDGGPSPELAGVLQFLALLQREGRLVDFLAEDVSSYTDAEIGGAARVVHGGCKKALAGCLDLEPVFPQGDGAIVEVPRGFDASAIRLTGNVFGEPPFKGSLTHHGWRVKAMRFTVAPSSPASQVLAPAEVELP